MPLVWSVSQCESSSMVGSRFYSQQPIKRIPSHFSGCHTRMASKDAGACCWYQRKPNLMGDVKSMNTVEFGNDFLMWGKIRHLSHNVFIYANRNPFEIADQWGGYQRLIEWLECVFALAPSEEQGQYAFRSLPPPKSLENKNPHSNNASHKFWLLLQLLIIITHDIIRDLPDINSLES